MSTSDQKTFSAPLTIAAGERTSRRLYECAAWFTDMASIEQVATISYQPSNPRSISGDHVYCATVEAVVTDDFFPSLFCGNMIGKAYDRTQNVGKPEKFTVRFSAESLLSEPRVTLTDEQYEACLAEAIEKTADFERFLFGQVCQRRGDGTPCSDPKPHSLESYSPVLWASDATSLGKYAEKLNKLVAHRNERNRRRGLGCTVLPRFSDNK